MTVLYDDPAEFSRDMQGGFVAANHRYVRAVPGGVVRSERPARGKVAVVVGGGSGHYPAFCGVVGPGFADGAAIGNVFTSPSADEAYAVARAADAGGGVLLTYGNYAGDVLNFGLAQQRLNADGVPTQTVVVTDDIASAVPEDGTEGRGIAGGFVVFKVASAAADEGADLDGVRAAAQRANAATRSLGVAFAGCTLPGSDEPLFTVPDGRMGVGLGIHGEAGVSEHEITTAGELAELLVGKLLAEKPSGAGDRVAVILNGLGATKYEELFVVYRHIDRLLSEAGLDVVEPEVDEFVTSLDMAGCSLTLTFLDEDLERWWAAPADSPAYRKGVAGAPPVGADAAPEVDPSLLERHATIPVAGGRGQEASASVLTALQEVDEALAGAEQELGRIDAVAGDGDHGQGMVRGIRAAVEAATRARQQKAGPKTMMAVSGDAWAAAAGGTAGALWGACLNATAGALADDEVPGAPQVRDAARRALEAIRELGGADVGDKTIVDALAPFVEELDRRIEAGSGLAEAWTRAAEVATGAAEQTADLLPRKGRARPLGERSVGTPDAGATSMALVLTAAGSALGQPPTG